jgi:membrane-associated PAP2 superfamily phosphatase
MISYKPKILEHLLLCIFFLALMVLFHETNLDKKIASQFYLHSEWIYRDNFFLEKILHKGGVLFTITALVGLVGYLIYLWPKAEQKQRRDYIAYIITSCLISILAVFFLKCWSTFPCPWNSVDFGGGTLIPSIWQMFAPGLPSGKCFPGGHSSGGYAFLSVYFGYLFIYGKRKFLALLPGIIIGVLFGVTQQLRGAHFLSHDMATISICIMSSLVTSCLYSIYNKNI